MIIAYLAAIVAANLTVAMFGPGMIVVNAALFIGLDLTARDRLHEQWHGDRLALKMALLIAAGSAISWMLNRSAGQIAMASAVSFAAAAAVDAVVFHRLDGHPRWLRVNGSNIPSALVDSVLFPALAFGALLPAIVLGQFAAKVVGGIAWERSLSYYERKRKRTSLSTVDSDQ